MSEKNIQEKMHLSTYIISSPHSEYAIKSDSSVVFINEDKKIRKQIVTPDGNICDFPGIEYTEELKNEIESQCIEPIVKYEVVFEKVGDKFIMVWTVRPDGRYWMDSWGFGAEDYESLSLYSYIDSDGNFTMPFKLYSIGYNFYGDYRLTYESHIS